MTIIIIGIPFSCRLSTNRTIWTVKQKEEFALKCSQTYITDNLVFYFTGFEYNEIKSVGVRHIHNGHTVDSFYVYPDKYSFDSARTRYSASIARPIYIKDTYLIIIPGHNSYILSDMKMIIWNEFTSQENYGCEMGDYKINGIRFEDNGNPDFVKNGFKF